MSDTELSAFKARAQSCGDVKPLKLTRPEPKESDIQNAILRALKIHPAVGRSWRQNTGAVATGEGRAKRFIRYGFKGQPDIQGYLKGSGRALYIEVKRPSGRVSTEQQQFIDDATKAGALAFVARSVQEVWQVLDGELRGQGIAQKETDAIAGLQP